MIATLTREQMQRQAPSIFAATAWHGMSARYRQVPTIEVLDMLADRGFLPVKVVQGKSRIADKAEFTKHLIRLRQVDYLHRTAGEEIPELVLSNSHDGTACYRFQSGIFRLVCSNGLVVAAESFGGISVRHAGGPDFQDRVVDATYRIVEDTPRTLETVAAWKQIELSPPKQLAFAKAALEIRDGDATIPAAGLLDARRSDDRPDGNGNRSLWTTLNTVQEAMVKGGVRGRSQSGRRMRTRPIQGVDADLRTNRALWRLAEEMAKLA